MATFFCDLRGFTPLTAVRQPDEVRELLDRFYEYVAGAVLGHGGTVIQFVGDEVFAVFGAPMPNATPVDVYAAAHFLLQHEDAFATRWRLPAS